MVLASYIAVKWFPGGVGAFLAVINCLVHSIMYTYYFLTAFNPELKKSVWWKKHITQIQLIQFFANTVYFLRSAMANYCGFPRVLSVILFIQNIFMLILFGDFYRKAYLTTKKLNRYKHKISSVKNDK